MTVYTFQPSGALGMDTYIQSFAPNTNFGTATAGLVGEGDWDVGIYYRYLIKFDLSPIQAGSAIASAVLTLYHTSEGASNARTMRVYRQKRAWTEGGATWNKYDGVNNWQAAGGFGVNDCEQTDIGSIALSATEANGAKDITLTASVKEDLDLGYGWLLKMDTELNDAHEFATSDHATASYHPKLVVTTINPAYVKHLYYRGHSRLDLTKISRP